MIRIALDWTLPRLLKNENSSEKVKYSTINISVCDPLLDWFFQSQNEYAKTPKSSPKSEIQK